MCLCLAGVLCPGRILCLDRSLHSGRPEQAGSGSVWQQRVRVSVQSRSWLGCRVVPVGCWVGTSGDSQLLGGERRGLCVKTPRPNRLILSEQP